MAARMISLLRFKGRRVAALVHLGAACLMLIVICSLFMVWFVVRGICPTLTGHCLAPDGLNSRAPMLACPHHQGETSATIGGVGSRHVSPSPPEHRVTGRTWSCPPPMRSRNRGHDASPMEETLRALRSGRPSSHIPIRTERSTLTATRSRRAGMKPYRLETGPGSRTR